MTDSRANQLGLSDALVLRRPLDVLMKFVGQIDRRLDHEPSLGADLLGEPLAGCLTRDAERDPDLAP